MRLADRKVASGGSDLVALDDDDAARDERLRLAITKTGSFERSDLSIGNISVKNH